MPARDNKTTHRSLYPCEGCCANYRVAVGYLGTNAIRQLYLNMTIRGLYCMNYRVAVVIMVSSYILVLRKTCGILIPILLIIYEFGITTNL